ncbi:carboxypeptidase-like regulatory domain-containing protein [Flavobacterium beibuense]|uniref:Surface protein with CnaB domain n=1 Tax=Flavobacterium beibuense TaxID=657326 RepID=A0A444WIR1_9FLAO|nr:carboxypeptidase-like regulatory domain-containing protein [Flavobacterium beibuense]RYJ45572.1 surface protein with CnaB domain [Flavobacterium beibuense]
MKTKILLFVILLLTVTALKAQSVSGYVYDEKEDIPLEGAFVYLDGTTYSASTDSNGAFSINTGQQLSAALVVKYMGYQTRIVQNPFSYEGKIKILLKEDAIKMEEVVINKKTAFSRKEMLQVFREQFLGKTKAGKSCKILNEDDIILYYDLATNTLKAEANKPIQITNKKLKYEVQFDLVDFQVHFGRKTLSPFAMQTSFYAGTSFFKDVSKKESIKEDRDEVYKGSLLHFMRAIAANEWNEEKYALYVESFPANPNDYFKVSDTLDYKKVTCLKTKVSIPETNVKIQMNKELSERTLEAPKERNIRFAVLHDGEQQSFFEMNADHFYIGSNGLFWPITSMVFGGYFGELKVGDMLPADYTYIDN